MTYLQRLAYILSCQVFISISQCCWADFDKVINVPPEVPMGNVVYEGTQLNVFDGALFEEGIAVVGGAEANIYGGEIDFFLEPSGRDGDPPSRINFFDGKLDGGIYAGSPNAVINIHGGEIGHVHAWEGIINVHGGVTNDFLHSGTIPAEVTGGVIAGDFSIYTPGKARISGGRFEGAFVVYDSTEDNFPAVVELTGRQFSIDGVDITPSLLPNVPFTIEQRDVNLSGVLADGSEFSFDLNSNSTGRGSDHVSQFADLTISLIPEPSAAALLLFTIVFQASVRGLIRVGCLPNG